MDHAKLLAYTIDPIGPPITGQPVTQMEKILSNLVGILTIVAFIYFAIKTIFAGYSYISANGDESKLKEARNQLTHGILGIFIVVVALGLASLLSVLLGINNIFDLNKMFTNMGL